MRFKVLFGFGNNMKCQFCRSVFIPNRSTLNNNVPSRMLTSNGNFKDEELVLFFKNEVQTLLRKLTGLNLEKVFASRKLGEKLEPPKYKFMTTDQVEKAIEKSKKEAEEMLQMPPVVPVRKEIDVVLTKDPELIGYSESKFVFTDISFGKTDRTRTIVVRDLDGTLRQAFWSERRNANQTYFPRPGREFKAPKMFQPEYLKPILERGDYVFILDRACVEYDADDPDYHRVTQATYSEVDEKQAYSSLRFTRHYGPMVFYLVLNKNIDNLLLENLKTDRLDDAAALISLYHIIHPSAKSAAAKLTPGQEIAFVKEYIDKDSKTKIALELALMPYVEPSREVSSSSS
uniref:28S ribosomal protein S22, mitochondrial n=1 Tax=Graphocephala atropunctata TaxID=36148 RepID=A0A1B6LWW5_9HEMI